MSTCRAREQIKDAAICVTAKTRRRRLVLPVMRTPPLAGLVHLRRRETGKAE